MFSIFGQRKENECTDPDLYDKLDANIRDHLDGLKKKSNERLDKITKTFDLVERLTEDARKDQEFLRLERDIWKATFNAIPTLIAILDKNRNIQRVNRAFLDHVKLSEGDIIGKGCNEILDSSFCDCKNKCYIDGNIKLDFKTCLFKDKYYTISYVPIINRKGQLEGHVIQYQEVTDKIQKQLMLNRRDAIINAINSTTENMLKDTTAQNGFRIEQMISKLGKAAEVSRVSVFQNKSNDGKLTTNQKYEWCADGVTPQKRNPLVHNIDFDTVLPRWKAALSNGETISGSIENFPESEKQLFDQLDVRSLLCVPIYVSDVWTGMMVITQTDMDRVWQDPEIQAFQMAANVLGAWIERGKVEEALRELIKNSNPNKKKLGEYIVEEGLLSQEQLEQVLKKQEKETPDEPGSSYKYVCINLKP